MRPAHVGQITSDRRYRRFSPHGPPVPTASGTCKEGGGVSRRKVYSCHYKPICRGCSPNQAGKGWADVMKRPTAVSKRDRLPLHCPSFRPAALCAFVHARLRSGLPIFVTCCGLEHTCRPGRRWGRLSGLPSCGPPTARAPAATDGLGRGQPFSFHHFSYCPPPKTAAARTLPGRGGRGCPACWGRCR